MIAAPAAKWGWALFIAGLVFCLLAGVLATARGMKVTTVCGPTVTTPLIVRGGNTAEKLGESLKDMVDDGGPTVVEMFRFGIRVSRVWLMWSDAFHNAFAGDKPPTALEEQRRIAIEAQQKALAACCPAAPVNPNAPPQTNDPNSGNSGRSGSKPDPRDSITVVSSTVDPQTQQEQTDAIAATAIAVGKGMDIPEQGWVVAIAAGMQESGGGKPYLLNLSYGDRDSIGWLQQRPSAGWGSVSQIMQPAYAARKFYLALQNVPGWEQMSVTRAAQAVQRSAFPNAYARWQTPARDLVAKLGGTGAKDGAGEDGPAYCNPATAEKNVYGGTFQTASATEFGKAISKASLNNPRTPTQALAWLAAQHQNSSSACLHYVAAAYGYNTTATASPYPRYAAYEQWHRVPAKYRLPTGGPYPDGTVLYWGPTATNPYGHVALAQGGKVLSTGVGPGGGVALKPMSYFSGYGEFLGGTLPVFWQRTTTGTRA